MDEYNHRQYNMKYHLNSFWRSLLSSLLRGLPNSESTSIVCAEPENRLLKSCSSDYPPSLLLVLLMLKSTSLNDRYWSVFLGLLDLFLTISIDVSWGIWFSLRTTWGTIRGTILGNWTWLVWVDTSAELGLYAGRTGNTLITLLDWFVFEHSDIPEWLVILKLWICWFVVSLICVGSFID